EHPKRHERDKCVNGGEPPGEPICRAMAPHPGILSFVAVGEDSEGIAAPIGFGHRLEADHALGSITPDLRFGDPGAKRLSREGIHALRRDAQLRRHLQSRARSLRAPLIRSSSDTDGSEWRMAIRAASRASANE